MYTNQVTTTPEMNCILVSYGLILCLLHLPLICLSFSNTDEFNQPLLWNITIMIGLWSPRLHEANCSRCTTFAAYINPAGIVVQDTQAYIPIVNLVY